MYSPEEIAAAFTELGLTHVVWIPDTTTGQWADALQIAPDIKLIQVCREGEAWALAAGLSLVLIALAAESGPAAAAGLFFGSGALLLVSGLTFLSLWLRGGRSGAAALRRGRWATTRMGWRNSQRQPGRSMLCAALVASACFVIVAVGANRRTEGTGPDSGGLDSGTSSRLRWAHSGPGHRRRQRGCSQQRPVQSGSHLCLELPGRQRGRERRNPDEPG